MTTTVTFGNSGHAPVVNPTKASQLFFPAGNYKCTIEFGKDPLIVENDLGFNEFMMLGQTFNNRALTWGAANKDGVFTDSRQAQQSMLIFRHSKSGQADLVEAPNLRFQGAGTGVFAYGKDN
jgi:hypothetical protein